MLTISVFNVRLLSVLVTSRIAFPRAPHCLEVLYMVSSIYPDTDIVTGYWRNARGDFGLEGGKCFNCWEVPGNVRNRKI